jgi:hypothetical protein
MDIGISLGQGGPRFFMGGGNMDRLHPSRRGHWGYDPMSGERCWMNGPMSRTEREFRIMYRASGGDPRFFNRNRPRPVDGEYPYPDQGDYPPDGSWNQPYPPNDRVVMPPRTDLPRDQGRDPYDYSGAPEDGGVPRPEQRMRRQRPPKEHRPSGNDVRGARSGDDSPTNPEVYARMQQIARQLEGKVITDYDKQVTTDLGCTRAVTLLAGNAYGIPDKMKEIGNAKLEEDLPHMGFVQVRWEDRRAGDIMVAHRNPGEKSHAAVYMGHGMIFNNSSIKGIMTTESEAKLYDQQYKEIIVWRKVR